MPQALGGRSANAPFGVARELRQPDFAHPHASRLDAMRRAFAPTGGILSTDCLLQLLRHRLDQPISTLARWIASGDVVSFEARGSVWLPMFQFEPSTLQLRSGVTKAARELRGVLDDWELAAWFAHPNSSLQGLTPADAVLRDEHTVHEAAQVDRFVATGLGASIVEVQ